MSALPILIMAGGTGGHVFPALAVAEELRDGARPVVWLGTRSGLEARVVPAAGIPVEWITVSGLRGKGLANWVAAPFRLAWAVWQALRILRRRRPAAVLGMGGFVSGPGGLAAWLLRKPLVIHEQNAIAGLTNRILARLAREVLEAFPGSFTPGVRARRVGNPVRRAILRVPEPVARMAERTARPRLLVLGGSLGALALNVTVPAALARLVPGERPEVWHQTGERTREQAEQAYRECGVEARLEPFIEDMAGAYGWADLVLCRAGALTVTELADVGVGSILVPFPYAVDDHQTGNALFLAREEAAILVPQSELDAARLASELKAILADRGRMLAMARTAHALAIPDAAAVVAGACVAAAEARA